MALIDDDDDRSVTPSAEAFNLPAKIAGWLSGIPKAFRAPLLKALNRLLLGTVNVPVAALEAKVDNIKHAQRMREKFRAALVKGAIENFPENRDLADRALDYFFADIIGKQENREGVVRHAMDELAQSLDDQAGPPKAPEDLGDDWLNSFARYADAASSERLQALFGRILAGEVRRPGAYSLFTVDFLAKLGQRDAELITRVAPFVIADIIILTQASRAVLDFELASALGALNIATATSIGISSAATTFRTEKNAIPSMGKSCSLLATDRNILVIATAEPKIVTVECTVLTQIGSEVLSLHVCDLNRQMIKELATNLKKQDAELYVGDIVSRDASAIRWENLRAIPIEIA